MKAPAVPLLRFFPRIVQCSRLHSALMACLDAARWYPFHVQVAGDWEVVEGMALAWAQKYPDLLATPGQANYLRLLGRPRHRMVIFRGKEQGAVVLFASHEDPEEHWMRVDDRKERLRVLGFELVRLPRPGQSRPSWTWRMEKDKLRWLKEKVKRFIHATHGKDDEGLLRLMDEIRSMLPGFAGVRAQYRELTRYAEEVRRKVGGRKLPPLKWPRLPYVTRKSALRGRYRSARRKPVISRRPPVVLF